MNLCGRFSFVSVIVNYFMNLCGRFLFVVFFIVNYFVNLCGRECSTSLPSRKVSEESLGRDETLRKKPSVFISLINLHLP